MKKQLISVLIISMISVNVLNSMILGQGYYDYDSADEAIWAKVHQFQFTYSSSDIIYAVYLGLMVEEDTQNVNDKGAFESNAFVKGMNDKCLTSTTATLTFNLTVTYLGSPHLVSDAQDDTSSFFICTSTTIYMYNLTTFEISDESFPLTVEVFFEYNLTSSEFSDIGSYTGTQEFSSPNPDAIPWNGIIPLTFLIIGLISIIWVRRKAEGIMKKNI